MYDTEYEIENKTSVAQVTKGSTVPHPAQRRMPRQVRRALLVFCIVGVLSLLTDGVLLALSRVHHHTAQTTQDDQPAIVFQPKVMSIIDHRPSLSTKSTRPDKSTTPDIMPSMLMLSSSHLTFLAIQGQSNPAPQTVMLSGREQAFSWLVVPAKAPPAWLQLSALQGAAAVGVAVTFEVSVHPENLALGSYTTNLLVKAFTSQDKMLVGSPKMLLVTLDVRSPCMLSVTPMTLSFAAGLESAHKPQMLGLTENSSCALPVYWQVTADAPWVTFFRSSGVDDNSGNSIIVFVNSSILSVGSYQASILLQGTDSSGAPLVITPAKITVTLTVSTPSTPTAEAGGLSLTHEGLRREAA